jgi:hypothetical protein
MSRSYRKPYHSVVCCGSSRWDKTQAHRGERRTHRKFLEPFRAATTDDLWEPDCKDLFWRAYDWVDTWDAAPLPERHSCPHNNKYVWNCDGGRVYYGPNPQPVSTADGYDVERSEFLRKYHERLCRK